MPNDKLKQIVNLIKSAEGVSIGALVDRMNLVIKDNNLTREALNDVITAFKQLRDIAVENGVFDSTIAKIEESITKGDDIVSKSVDSKLSASEKKIVSKINDTVNELRQELSAIIPEQFDPTYIEESIKDIEVSLTDTFDKKFDKKIEDAIKNIKFPEVKDYSQDIVDLRNTVALVGTKNYTPAGIEIFHNGRNYGRIPSINFKNGNIEVSASRVDVDLGSGTSSGGGHTIQDEGTPLTQRTNLNFVGAGVAVTDDAGNDATVVTINAGSYTDEQAQDAVGTILVDSSEIDFTYDDATPSITASLKSGSIDETKLDVSVNASLDLADTAVQPAALASYVPYTGATSDVNLGSHDLEIGNTANGIILKSPDGTRWRIGITNSGQLTATSL